MDTFPKTGYLLKLTEQNLADLGYKLNSCKDFNDLCEYWWQEDGNDLINFFKQQYGMEPSIEKFGESTENIPPDYDDYKEWEFVLVFDESDKYPASCSPCDKWIDMTNEVGDIPMKNWVDLA